MNYKSLIPNQELRLSLLKVTEFIPDKQMIKLQYKIATGRKLDLINPRRFTEKLQWYKLYYRDSRMTKSADKYQVREYIVSKGYKEILVPLYGVYEKVEEIDFDTFPNSFVLKTTNGSQTNIICEDKSKLDLDSVKKTLNSWLFKRTSKAGREWPYYNIMPRIICEEYLPKDDNGNMVDYKFVCFEGKVAYVFVNTDRSFDGGLRFGIYNEKFEKLPYGRKGLKKTTDSIIKPINYEKMIEIAEALSKDFPHVRIDLYNIEGKIYFGEMTFFHGSGYVEFEPDEFDYILGEKFKVPLLKS
ncbi:ATP-grasp fold amidoligase family protein [Salinicoccus siamensis]|uniref:ATP-grasp fold amidoligase family protein n=1 Tax=Salinicoccus siamensis TaxID=381830 RepID=A0ABV5Z5Q2_9STAP